MRTLCKRLTEGADLYESLNALAKENNVSAACVLSLVGCLKHAVLRRAGGDKFVDIDGPLEIVSATGTLSRERTHIHISVSDKTLSTFGGHMRSGCIVATTVEVVLLIMDDTRFSGEFDPHTGYNELTIHSEA